MTTKKCADPIPNPEPSAEDTELAEASAAVLDLEAQKHELIVGHRLALEKLGAENKAALLANGKATVAAKERLHAAQLAMASAALGELAKAAERRLDALVVIHRQHGSRLRGWASTCASGVDREKRERLAAMYSRAGTVQRELAEAHKATETALKHSKEALVTGDASSVSARLPSCGKSSRAIRCPRSGPRWKTC